MNIYVSGLSYALNSDDLRLLFEQYGEVTSARVINDKFTGQSRGFGFVEMTNGGNEAIESLNNTSVKNKTISVSVAKPQVSKNNTYYGNR